MLVTVKRKHYWIYDLIGAVEVAIWISLLIIGRLVNIEWMFWVGTGMTVVCIGTYMVGGWKIERKLFTAEKENDLLKEEEEKRELPCIEPDFYDTLEEAIEAFKELETTTFHPVLCGNGEDGCYGVFDESIVLGLVPGVGFDGKVKGA